MENIKNKKNDTKYVKDLAGRVLNAQTLIEHSGQILRKAQADLWEELNKNIPEAKRRRSTFNHEEQHIEIR